MHQTQKGNQWYFGMKAHLGTDRDSQLVHYRRGETGGDRGLGAKQTTEIIMAPGDFLMLFTDGLYEVQGANEELYSQQRLLLDVEQLLGRPAGELFDSLLETIRTFATDQEFEDDVCLVGMEFNPPPPANA